MGLFSISPWKWPLPRGDEEKLVVLHRLFIWLTTESAYRLFVRQHNFEVYGFVHRDSMLLLDEGYGRAMPWHRGIRFVDNELTRWKEPKVRKQPVTGALEETVHQETRLMVITTRNTNDYSDDDDNFTFVIGAREAENYHLLKQHINEQRAANSEINEQANNFRLMVDELASLADITSRRANRLNEKNAYYAKENADLREQIAGQKAKVREMKQMVGYEEAKLSELDKLAISRGHFDGKDMLSQVQEVMTKIQAFQTKSEQLIPKGASNEKISSDTITTLVDEMGKQKEVIIKLVEEFNKGITMLTQMSVNAPATPAVQQPQQPIKQEPVNTQGE
jgi:hypothetical protein